MYVVRGGLFVFLYSSGMDVIERLLNTKIVFSLDCVCDKGVDSLKVVIF